MQKIIERIECEIEEIYNEVLDGCEWILVNKLVDGEVCEVPASRKLKQDDIKERYRKIENLKKQLADLYGLAEIKSRVAMTNARVQ